MKSLISKLNNAFLPNKMAIQGIKLSKFMNYQIFEFSEKGLKAEKDKYKDKDKDKENDNAKSEMKKTKSLLRSNKTTKTIDKNNKPQIKAVNKADSNKRKDQLISDLQEEQDSSLDKINQAYKDKLKSRMKEIDNIILQQSDANKHDYNPLLKRRLKHTLFKHKKEDFHALKKKNERISRPICKTPKDFYYYDKVLVQSGEFKGKIGKVVRLSLKQKTVTVEGVNTKKCFPSIDKINQYFNFTDEKANRIKDRDLPKQEYVAYPIPMKDVAVLSPFSGKVIKPVFEYINDEEGYVRKCPDTNKVIPFPVKYVKSAIKQLKGNPYKSSARSTRNKALMLKTFKGYDYVNVVQDFLARKNEIQEKSKKLILKDRFFSNQDLL